MRRTLMLAPAQPGEVSFSIDEMLSKRYWRVVKVVRPTAVHTTVVCDDGELCDPAADPLIVGTVVDTSGPAPVYNLRVLWGDRLWVPLDGDVGDALMDIHEHARRRKCNKYRLG